MLHSYTQNNDNDTYNFNYYIEKNTRIHYSKFQVRIKFQFELNSVYLSIKYENVLFLFLWFLIVNNIKMFIFIFNLIKIE